MSQIGEFQREQIEILRFTDKIKYDEHMNKKEKHDRYVDILKAYIEKHTLGDFQLIKSSFVDGALVRFDLIMVAENGKPMIIENATNYDAVSVVAVIKIAGHGLVNYKEKLEDDVKGISAQFQEIKAKNPNAKCLYLTLEERQKVSKGTNYDELSRKHLGASYFSLRDSTTGFLRLGEWKRFIKVLLEPSEQ